MDLSELGDDDTPGVSEVTASFSGIIPTVETLDELSEAVVDAPSYQDAVIGVFKVKDTCR
jgi:hypothetical protein